MSEGRLKSMKVGLSTEYALCQPRQVIGCSLLAIKLRGTLPLVIARGSTRFRCFFSGSFNVCMIVVRHSIPKLTFVFRLFSCIKCYCFLSRKQLW